MSKFITLVLVVLFVVLGWKFTNQARSYTNQVPLQNQTTLATEVVANANASDQTPQDAETKRPEEKTQTNPTQATKVVNPPAIETKLASSGKVVSATLKTTRKIQPKARARLSTIETTIYFDSGKSKVSNNEEIKLKKLVESIKSTSITKVKLKGFTDSAGSIQANSKISAQRINSLITYLKTQGIKASFEKQIIGSSQAIDNNKTVLGRANNRRVEIITY